MLAPGDHKPSVLFVDDTPHNVLCSHAHMVEGVQTVHLFRLCMPSTVDGRGKKRFSAFSQL